MNRLGFDMDTIEKLCGALKSNARLKVQSIFSHLSASGNKNFETFTHQHLDLFNSAAKKIETTLGYTTLKHIANSDAILLNANFHLDMVRLGIGLYGATQGAIALEPVIQLTTTISQIRHLKKGDTVRLLLLFHNFTSNRRSTMLLWDHGRKLHQDTVKWYWVILVKHQQHLMLILFVSLLSN